MAFSLERGKIRIRVKHRYLDERITKFENILSEEQKKGNTQ